jgi:hypothetical protein
MKLQRSTLVLTLSACVLTTAYFIYDLQVAPHQEAAEQKSKRLFQFQEEDVVNLQILLGDTTFSFERKAQDSELNPWMMNSPEITVANDASVAFLLNLLATGESTQTLSITPDRQQEFGFDQPLATIEVTLKDKTSHRLVLGTADFDRTGIYAQVDPVAGEQMLTVRVLPTSFENAVSRPPDDWKKPPAPSPTPSTSPEAPSPEAPSFEAPSPEVPSPEAPSSEAPSPEAPSPEAPSPEAPSSEAPSPEPSSQSSSDQ